MDGKTCRRATLARNGAGSVQRCTCGTVHLTIGPATLRLPPEAVAALRELLSDAAAVMARAGGRSPDRLPH